MLIKKSEITELSDGICKAINGQEIDFRDNREGAFSALKNDINTLVSIHREQTQSAQKERDLLANYMADISHQLKTPITSMLVMADLLENSPADKQTEFIESIKTSLTRMEWLVDVLLRMAKLDSGSVAFSSVEVSAGELLKTAQQPLEILFDIKNQSVQLAHDMALRCDRRWTSEALTNLLKNASEYSPEGSLILVDSGDNPIYRWISVTDCGKGVPREKRAALFTRFTYSQGEKGYGIGLPLALSIIRGQNGDIDLDNDGKEKGATFTIKFFK